MYASGQWASAYAATLGRLGWATPKPPAVDRYHRRPGDYDKPPVAPPPRFSSAGSQYLQTTGRWSSRPSPTSKGQHTMQSLAQSVPPFMDTSRPDLLPIDPSAGQEALTLGANAPGCGWSPPTPLRVRSPPVLLIVIIVSSAQDSAPSGHGGGTVSIRVIRTYRDTERRDRAE